MNDCPCTLKEIDISNKLEHLKTIKRLYIKTGYVICAKPLTT